LAILIVIATSRISMSAVNGQLEQGRPGAPPATTTYLARPPRRYLAIFCIAVCSATEFALGHDIITGWTALAAAAAMFNLLNDWHVGRPLFTRWSLMLYASYWLIALGYGLLGAAWLGAPMTASAGRHLLTAGAMALSIFAVMVMVGRIHAGLWLDYRPWLPLTAAMLVLAALLRTWAGVWAAAPWHGTLLTVSGLLWVSAFAIYLGHTWPALSGPRTDGQEGCAEPLGRGTGSGGGGACRSPTADRSASTTQCLADIVAASEEAAAQVCRRVRLLEQQAGRWQFGRLAELVDVQQHQFGVAPADESR